VVLKAIEANGKYWITELAKNKYGELNAMYHITEKTAQTTMTSRQGKGCEKQAG